MRVTAIAAGVIMASGVVACAQQKQIAPAPPASRYLITSDELAQSSEIMLYDAIRRLRPNFLKTRGLSAYGAPETTRLTLYVDGQRMDTIDDILRISCKEVLEVRFYEPQVANTKFAGHDNSGGAIAVTLKPLPADEPASSPAPPPPARRHSRP